MLFYVYLYFYPHPHPAAQRESKQTSSVSHWEDNEGGLEKAMDEILLSSYACETQVRQPLAVTASKQECYS